MKPALNSVSGSNANLELLTESGKYNYAAYLLADRNGTSIKVAKYAGTDRVDLIESNEYGYCSLIKATKQVLDKLQLENRTETRITSKERIDQRLWSPVALREAVINAIVHNDYSNEVPPKIELFADRLEITSAGGIPKGLSQAEFFEGYSVPRNKELMRIFKDLEMVEYLGSGLPRILKAYTKDAFVFTPNFIRTTFQYEISSGKGSGKGSGKITDVILRMLANDPETTIPAMAAALGLSTRAVERHIAKLKQQGHIARVGGRKTGHWKIIDSSEGQQLEDSGVSKV